MAISDGQPEPSCIRDCQRTATCRGGPDRGYENVGGPCPRFGVCVVRWADDHLADSSMATKSDSSP